MHQSRFDKNFLIAAAIIIVIILYLSLYPFTFRQPANGIGPVRTLVESGAELPHRADFLANILFYVPLGLFAALAIGGKRCGLRRMCLATVIGALLGTSMELAQYYVEGRVTAATDVYANVIGTALGAVVGSITSGNFRWALLRDITANRVPALLLLLWLGYRLFPYVPTIDLHKYWDAVKPVVLSPTLTGYDLFRYTAIWLAICCMIEAIAGPKRAWLLFSLFIGTVLVAKLLIVNQTLSMAEISGAAAALCAWLVLALSVSVRLRLVITALIFFTYVLLERLEPFRFIAGTAHFGWVPFLSLMYGSIEVNIMSFFEKAFLYGGSIWLLGKAGLGVRTSTIFVAAALFITSWLEIYLPNRSAEITDCVMALFIGGIIGIIETEPWRKGHPVAGTP